MSGLKPFLTYFLIFSGFFLFIFSRWTRRRLGFQLPLLMTGGLLAASLFGLSQILRGATGLSADDLYFRAYILGGALVGLTGALLGHEVTRTPRGLSFLGFYVASFLLFFVTLRADWRSTAILLYGVQAGATFLMALLTVSVPEEWLEKMGA